MSFQYFFFDTYIGYFLQVLPIALLVSAVYGILKYRKDRETPALSKVMSCLFVCYTAGLVCLVLFLRPISMAWYRLIYRRPSGMTMYLFSLWSFDFVPDFWAHIDKHSIGNLLAFIPFGFLYPFFKRNASFGKILLEGLICTSAIELIQPVFGRAFDINDIILNFVGVAVGGGVYMLCRHSSSLAR